MPGVSRTADWSRDPQAAVLHRRAASLHPDPPISNDAMLLSRLRWLEDLEPRHRCAGMVTHGMCMAMREDHQVAFGEKHRLVSPFHGEPACSSRDKLATSLRDTRKPQGTPMVARHYREL